MLFTSRAWMEALMMHSHAGPWHFFSKRCTCHSWQFQSQYGGSELHLQNSPCESHSKTSTAGPNAIGNALAADVLAAEEVLPIRFFPLALGKVACSSSPMGVARQCTPHQG